MTGPKVSQGLLRLLPLLMATAALAPRGTAAQVLDPPGFCTSRECSNFERIKAANLCEPSLGGAAAWADDPFVPSIRGVAFYDTFDRDALVERFGPPVEQTEWVDEYEERDPTTPEEVTRVPFSRYEFDRVAVETAALQQSDIGTKVTKIDISSPDIPLKCSLRIGMPWSTVRATLGLPERPVMTGGGCSVFYDLYDLPYDRGGYMGGDNSTICFFLEDERVSRILWDKTRWASGYH